MVTAGVQYVIGKHQSKRSPAPRGEDNTRALMQWHLGRLSPDDSHKRDDGLSPVEIQQISRGVLVWPWTSESFAAAF